MKSISGPQHCLFVTCVLLLSIIFSGCEKDPGGSDSDDFSLGITEELVAFPLPERINLSWYSVSGAESYTLYWTDDGTDPTANSNSIAGITEIRYLHQDLDHTKTYKYRLQAVAGNQIGGLSPVSSAQPQPPMMQAPENLAVSVNGGNAELSWTSDNADGIVYRVKRRCPATDYSYTVIADNLNSLTYTDTDLEIGKGYYYKVSAYDPSADNESEHSDPVYAATKREIFEHERNNENIANTLSYDTHYWDAEELTEDLDWYSIQGGYSGSYAIYAAAAYKSYEADCFLIGLEEGDRVNFSLINGEMGGLWAMEVEVLEFGAYTNGNDRELISHTFSGSSDSFTYDKSNTGTVFGTYLKVVMWDDLINTGPYNYEIEISIDRQP
jgi:hypothetical protein